MEQKHNLHSIHTYTHILIITYWLLDPLLPNPAVREKANRHRNYREGERGHKKDII